MSNEIIEVLGEARLDGQRISWPATEEPEDEAGGYRLQWALHDWLESRGSGAPAGWKIGATTSVMQELLAIDHPCAGGILAGRIYQQSADMPFRSLSRPGIECEIAVRLGQDVPASGIPYSAQTVTPFVGTAMAAMELVDDRYDDFRAWSPAALIADDFFQSAAVLGPEISDWQQFDLATMQGVTTIDGVEVGSGIGADVMGNPLAALAWLANTFAPLGRELKAGEVILLGSLVAVQWLDGPAEATTEIIGLGKVSLRLV